MPESGYYNTDQAAEVLGVHRSRVLQLRREGKLTAYTRGEKGSKSRLYFKAEDLEYYKVHKDDPKPLEPLHPVGNEKDTA